MFVYRFIFLVTTLTCVNNTLSAKSFKYLAHDLSQEQEVLLSQTFEHVYNIAENKLIIDYLSDVSAVIIFGLDSHQKSPGSYNRKKKLILFKDEKAINYHVLVEELFHAYQHQVITVSVITTSIRHMPTLSLKLKYMLISSSLNMQISSLVN